MILTKQDIADWKNHPVTKQFLEDLKESRELIKEDWAKEQYHSQDTLEGYRLNAGALGAVKAITTIIERIEDYEIEDFDDEDMS